MVAPSVSGVTLLRTTTVSTGIVSSDATINISTNSTHLVVSSLNTTTGVELWVEFLCDSTFNLSGCGFFFGFRHNVTLTTASFAFLSASGERRWNITSGTNNATEFYFDAEGSSFSDVGTFDITSVTKIRLYLTGSGSTGREVYLYRPYSYLKSQGVIFGDGEIGNALTPGGLVGLIQSLLNGASDGAEAISTNYVGLPVPLTLAPTVSTFLNGCIAMQPNDYSTSNGTNRPRISLIDRVFRVNSAAVQTFAGTHFVGIAGEEFAFADVSSYSNIYEADILILRHSTADLGLSVFKGVLASGTGSITGGTSFSGAVRSNTASYAIEWNGSTTFDGLDLTGTSNAHFINCAGANFIDGATLDVANIVFGTPGTNKVRVDAAGKTLNIQTVAGFTLSDVTVIAGTVNIISPSPTLTITGLVSGCEIRLYDLDSGSPGFLGTELAGEETLSGTTFDYIHSGTTNTIWVQVIATGYEEFGQSFVLGSTDQGFSIVLVPEVNI